MADEGKFREAMILKLFKDPYILLELEFLDISLTKDSSLLLHAIHGPFYWRILKRTIPFSGFQNPYEKACETRKLESIHFVEQKNEGRSRQKLESDKT